ncbi:MAG TPA: long-chain fatty acid--CoA ligase [Kiritimatiellia bacterium]|nr:long-chain fatty acid--CoA ligase [Kiritimatiellia bacterium]
MEAPTSIKNLSVPDALRQNAKLHAGAPAIVFGGRTLDFQTVDAQSDRVAAGLHARGIRKGDRVALYCINSDFFALAYFGIQKTGATVVPINLLLNPKEINYILKDSGAKAMIYFEAFAGNVKAATEDVELLGRACIGANKAGEGDLLWPELLSDQKPPAVVFNPAEDVAAILYTAGTTGHPKGAMLTHTNLVSNAWSVSQALPLEPGKDSILLVLPMFHAFAATAGMLYSMLHGICVIPLPRFEPHETAKALAATKAGMFMGVPSMYNVLLHLPDECTEMFSSLKYCISGGAAMPVEVMKAFETRYGKLIYEGDGPTECSPVTCVNPIGGKRKPASVGLPVPLVEMKIMDDTGKEVSHGTIGEICVRGPNVMKGYWNQPEETAASFFGEWFRTGDLGTEDDDGYFFIVDRKKDMLIVNGMNVYPRVVEEVLYQFEPVREAAVIGEPHELHGEIPVAYVALKEGRKATANDVRNYCRSNLGRYEVPRKVFFMDALPKNAAGKIMKRELRTHGELERGIDSRRDEPK